jgi:hypothetical protein
MKEALNLTFKKQHSLPRPVLSAMLRLIVAIPKTMPANDIFFRCAVEWTASVSLDVERPTFIEDSQMVDKLCSMVRRASSKTAAHALMLLKPIVRLFRHFERHAPTKLTSVIIGGHNRFRSVSVTRDGSSPPRGDCRYTSNT